MASDGMQLTTMHDGSIRLFNEDVAAGESIARLGSAWKPVGSKQGTTQMMGAGVGACAWQSGRVVRCTPPHMRLWHPHPPR